MNTLPERLRVALADRYRIEREVGAGGMATVYLALDLKHHRRVAVKVLRPELAATIGPDRFLREIALAAQLQHPHIVPLLDSGTATAADSRFLYYIMPYIEGESLRERLAREGVMPIPEALRILSEVADGLAHAHRRGVVHRDIKPDNVMLAERHALITDLGVARAVSAATGAGVLTSAGIAVGTPAYMAPEQAAGDPGTDHRADVYALGVMGYEMLTGTLPFPGKSAQEIVVAAMTRTPAPLDAARPDGSPALSAVIMRCLEKNPADRWQTADQLREQLDGLMTPGGSPPSVPATRETPRRLAWAAAALLAGGAVLLTVAQRRHPAITLGKRTAIAVAPEWEVHPSLSPDGKLLLYTVWGPTGDELDVQQVDGGAPVPLTGRLSGWQGYGALSPDGTRVLFLGAQGLSVMPALGGQARLLVSRPGGPAAIPGANTGLTRDLLWGAWSPDGRAIVYTSRDTLFVQSLDGLARVVTTGIGIHSPAWSPDGAWIAYVEGNANFHLDGNLAPSGLRLIRASGAGTPVRVTDDEFLNTSPAWMPGRLALLFVSDRDGGRDIYEIRLGSAGAPRGPPERITTGLNAEWVAVSANGKRMAWSVFTQTSNVWSLAIPARDSVPLSNAAALTTGTQEVESADISGHGEWLYYDSDRSGNADLWRQPMSGGPPEQLTTDPSGDFAPAVSPDGNEVAFHSFRTGNRDIFVMPAGGGPAVQVSHGLDQDINARWAPDGRALVWDEQGNPQQSLWTASRNPDGTWGKERPLAFGPGAAFPRWSPDGHWLAFRGPAGLELLSPITGEHRVAVPGSDKETIVWFDWSGDGRTLYYPFVDSLGQSTIRGVPVTGGRPRVLVYADEPLRQMFRYGFAVHGGRFFLPLMERTADVWVAEVQAQQ